MIPIAFFLSVEEKAALCLAEPARDVQNRLRLCTRDEACYPLRGSTLIKACGLPFIFRNVDKRALLGRRLTPYRFTRPAPGCTSPAL